MKASKYVLLVIGLLAIAAIVYNLFQGEAFINQIITLVCGASLIYGYFELDRSENK
ncbi:hypothetical protein [Xanthomarina spongicola]|uniref:Uncharacterized protein n=1 Tax=Xanthomarina spongicola TaxID=570520 RepID=A0A316DM66_9FLAO|nr:hypothetical protein [Xanthomarina spongicola]PWK18995.1 hypothetical protein LX78_01471 [Xanthomarina spongicola]